MDDIKEITDINSLVAKIQEVNKTFKGQVWWRGQRDTNWEVTPSIFRKKYERYDEPSGFRRFQQKAYARHPSLPLSTDKASWLFLMQHYGLPTRLLDWTESPLIACFFATELNPSNINYPEMVEDNDGALFALSPYALNKNQYGSDGLFMPDEDPVSRIVDCAFSGKGLKNEEILAVRPAEVDIRLIVQLSVFTIHGSRASLDNLTEKDDFLVKFRVPKEIKRDLREKLKYLGIRESNIFPDLEHLANEIKLLEFSTKQSSSFTLFDADLRLESST